MPVNKPTFREAFRFWLKLGFISFGGPAGQISIMHEYLVNKKKWISESKFLHALNYCMLLPGPEAQQLSVYTGWLMHGVRGGLTAGILFVLPSVFILLALSIAYVTYGQLPWVMAMFAALKPAVVAIVLQALLRMAAKSLNTPIHYIIAILAFILIFFFNIPFPFLMIGALVAGLIITSFFPAFAANAEKKEKTLNNEEDYFINRNSKIPHAAFSGRGLLRQLGIALILWILPLLLLFLLIDNDFKFWQTLVMFFTKAAFVTFGGAYAVLPYVAQVTVEKLHWLSSYQIIDGLALGETTPGPLIMVLVFVGFLAGYNHFEYSISAGILGLLLTTFYTFLPSFMFIFAGAPIIERTQHHSKVRALLGIIAAVVVGVILNLAIYFGKAVVFPKGPELRSADHFALVWIIISFIALYRLKIGMIRWIGISAFVGLIYYMFMKGGY